ncbi:hypothetical protein FGB62_13g123 [Gracilaria domingensis]|nr:hypothetical protein FGB62_13g123 [Gracilaria domingensis]
MSFGFQREIRTIRNKTNGKYRKLRRYPFWCRTACVLIVLFNIHHSRITADLLVRFAAVHFDQQKAEFMQLPLRQVDGGMAFRIPKTWNRLHSPWLKKSAPELKTPRQSRNRFLYGPSRTMSSDGIGHSMCSINLEYNLALNMNITYTHRIGYYSSLSRRDKLAVEEFFGWGVGEVPRTKIQTEGCSPVGGKWPAENNVHKCHVCGKPLENGSLNIERIVEVPTIFLDSNCPTQSECRKELHGFLKENSMSNTIFQLPKSSCSPQKTDANFLSTRNLFYNKYWNKHGRLPWKHIVGRRSGYPKQVLPLNPRELNIAIHVRRGDFLKANSGRKVTKDKVFATVIARVLTIIGNVGGTLAAMPVAIHIYSEGQLKTKNVLSIHMVELQDKKYYDHNGEPRDESWWTSLISSTLREDQFSSTGWEKRFRVQFHISENTLLSLHTMNAADVFIGSHSGLSTHLVWSTSRGVSLVPHSGSVDNEIGKKGHLCCSIPFKNDDGYFSLSNFRRYWEAYVHANEESARYSLHTNNGMQSLSNTISL